MVEPGLSSLAIALLDAGIVTEEDIDERRNSLDVGLQPDDIQDLLLLITVPGRFGLEVPFELLVRAWGRSGFSGLGDILVRFDIVHTREDYAGRLFVGPRAALEAQLITQSRLGTVEAEVGIVKRLLSSIRSSGNGQLGGQEIEFAVEFIRAIGPRSSERTRFAPYFLDFASSLHELRQARGLGHPRLMFHEALLMREWFVHTSQTEGVPHDNVDILDQHRDVLREALEIAETQGVGSGLKSPIATELASAAGSELRNLVDDMAISGDVLQAYERVKETVHNARVIDPSSYHPVDVLLWSTFYLLDRNFFNKYELTEALAEVFHATETINPDLLDSQNQSLFFGRLFELGQKIGQHHISDSAFEELEARGMTAGYYVRAIQIGGSDFNVTNIDESRADRCRKAWEFLEKSREKISSDPRCMNLLLDYWWLARTRSRFLTGERVSLPFSDKDWRYCLGIAHDLGSDPRAYRQLILRFLEAIALFHLGRALESLRLFREVENESNLYMRGARRIVRTYIASTPDGSPQMFHGSVRSVNPQNRKGEIHVDELGRRIPFFPSEFGRLDLRPGDSIGEFNIGFNFLGPVANLPRR